MRVRITKNSGARNYWRFPWLRFKAGYGIDWKPPILEAEMLKRHPDLKFPFIQPVDGRNAPEVYYPLEDVPAISRQFAALRNPDEALAFANAYGMLGLGDVRRYREYREELDANGENVHAWLSEAVKLRAAYEILDARDDPRKLRDLIAVTTEGAVIVLPKCERQPAGHPDPHLSANDAAIRKLKQPEIFKLAQSFIADRYNREMHQMASPVLLLNAKDQLLPYNAPASLLAALWLEFGQVASGVRKQMICESCGQWMDVTDNRTNKRKHDHCALREKMARYRSKKRLMYGETKRAR